MSLSDMYTLLHPFLSSLGMHDKEQEIYLALLQLGHSTASQVANFCNRERTSSYKLMMSMHHKGFLSMSGQGNNRLFASIGLDVLEKQFQQQRSKLNEMHQDFGKIQQEYQQLQNKINHRPGIELYEGSLGMQKAYQHILTHLAEHKLIYCHCIASKTFESLAQNNKELQTLHTDFLDQLQKSGLQVHGIYAQGMSLMESLTHSYRFDDLLDIPNTNNAIQIWITGNLVTTFIMKKNPQIIQITSHELANMWMFLAEQLSK